MWTNYDSPREIDEPALLNPVKLEDWLQSFDHEKRLALCNQNLVQTQLLYGQKVILLEEKNGWMHVMASDQPSSKDSRGYPGWIPSCQLKPKEDWEVTNGPVVVVTKEIAVMYNEDLTENMKVSYQTRLPLLREENDWVYVSTWNDTKAFKKEEVEVYESQHSIPKGNGHTIVAAGEKFLGLPYLWAGVSGFGYDCSGFSYSMCYANGYIIPRDAHDQAKEGQNVELTELEKGDLLFFAYEEGKGRIHHVGIYYGDGKMIHAPNTGKCIEVIELAGTIYEKELCVARRYYT
ncbi:C40 family peptidase [Cytobacillus suaedae]|nr:C40 family peptidase [Cytobacillus suaedae]